MDATEGAYVWNYTVRNCPEEELEELYKGKLGILDGKVVILSKASNGQRAWLRLEKGVIICGRRMHDARVRGMGQLRPGAGSDQAVHGTPGGKGVGKHEAGVELPEGP